MLKLKKLQILGFKSFCDRTELNFHGEGIAAVVGPNGCGKSNISDAISWVLGEQSAKSLRGIQMQDVIFAGTRERKPTGMAEVSLTLIDPEVYSGSARMEPEVEIKDDLDDWDEASLRAGKAQQTEEAILEVQPGKMDADGNPIIEPEIQVAGDGPEPEDAEGEAATDPEKVVLKIRRRKFKSNQFSAGEIVVTRRLFRSGDSEYLLNGKLCRLRDIQDLFMGTGLGPESYAIIEQGRIGQILSSKPYDRRAIIEEAAGITKYKTRKRLAELRLEQAKQNLSRVNDIFDEVSRQMNSLKRQASKAERYGKLRDEMRAKLRVVLASKFSQLSKEASGIEEEIKRLSEELLTKTASVEQMEAAHTQGMERGYAIDAEVKANAGQINALALEMDRSSARSRHNDERCSELGARTAISHAELERTANNLQSLESERESNRDIVESAAADVMAARDEATLKQQQAASASGKLGEVERLQEARRSGLMEVMSRAGRVRNQTTQAEEHIAALDREARRIDTESEGALGDIEALGGQRGQITMEFESHTEKVSGLTHRIEEGRTQLNAKRLEETEGKKNLDVLRAEYATALGKRNSLEAIIAEHGYSTESVKRLFQSGAFENGNAPVGVLADFLEVEGQHEVVVDEFLRDELNYIVVKSWDAANEGMRLLKSDVDGRATFLVHPSDSQAKFSFVADESSHYAPTRDAIVPLKNCIRVLNGFGKSLEVILPKLGNGYITPDSAIARELALENPDAFFLSPSGECFHNVTVTGGKQRSEGPLSLKRELREVLRILSGLEAGIAAGQFKVQILSREIVEVTGMLDRLQEEKREAEKQALTSGHALRQMESELTRVEHRLSNYRVERDRLVSQRREKEGLVAKFSEEAAEYEARRAAIESEVQTAQETLASLRQERDSAAQSAAETSARLATLEERRRGAVSALERIETLAVEVSKRMESLKKEIASAEAEKAQRESENVQIAERLVVLGADREKAQAAAAALHEESRLGRARIAELDQQLKVARHELNLVRDRRGDLLAAIARLKSDEEYMAQSCVNDLGVSAEELRAETGLALFEGDQLGAEDQAYREMRTRLEAMGPVNMMALEEYKETAQRYEFLEIQRKDLLDSIENTQSTIKEIDGVSRQKFQEAFEKINENFQVSFRKLFGGGQGFMKLTDIENSAESGIDIVASPPGKKLQNVLLLSGGEKALTALALLVGIFQYQPSPFCILDEVDAPLDEANVGRFNDMVKEMSGHTQFILITHSKRTMSNAPVMYGVTMQEPGVSKVVSVKFGEEPRLVAATA